NKMDASCKVQGSIHVFSLVHKYVSRILGTYQSRTDFTGVLYVIAVAKETVPTSV
ncbi:hypothetical protein SAMN02910339_02830, partial [Lachnospiraceae bacterium YSD2013]